VSLASEYLQQEQWRRWDEALDRLPLMHGQLVIDVGCGTGAVSARLFQRGLEVIGIDANEDLLAQASARVPSAKVVKLDVAELEPNTFGKVDGVWSSFVAAYFPDLDGFIRRLEACLRDGGWLALVEIDDLLGHHPRSSYLAEEIESFYAWARSQGGYGFEYGRRLAPAMRRAGLEVLHEGTLEDDELAFIGAAPPDVLDAWRKRLARMGGMHEFFGDRFPAVRDELLESLTASSHRSQCQVHLVVGRRVP
jgi:trans-aconitate methyltransferase